MKKFPTFTKPLASNSSYSQISLQTHTTKKLHTHTQTHTHTHTNESKQQKYINHTTREGSSLKRNVDLQEKSN